MRSFPVPERRARRHHDGTLRIGIHAISIGANENSESFVNVPIPEPTTALLLLAGLGGLAAFGPRRSVTAIR